MLRCSRAPSPVPTLWSCCRLKKLSLDPWCCATPGRGGCAPACVKKRGASGVCNLSSFHGHRGDQLSGEGNAHSPPLGWGALPKGRARPPLSLSELEGCSIYISSIQAMILGVCFFLFYFVVDGKGMGGWREVVFLFCVFF